MIIFILHALRLDSAVAQEMEVIRVLDNRIVCNQGSDDDVIKHQIYTIYRIMTTGPGSIGSARVIDVKSSICVLDVIEDKTKIDIKIGDILILSGETHSATSATKIMGTNKSSPYKGRIGIRGGIDTDTEGGLMGGGSLSYLVPTYPNPLEIGFLVLSGSIKEEIRDTHTYLERTDILATSFYINYLFNYSYSPQGLYFIVGTGLAFVDVMWEISSETDETLGKPLPEGGSIRSDEGGRIGILFDFGLGYKFSSSVDTRLELPILYINNPPGDASSIATALMLSLGVRFN
jgi:hypothetical protein